jgi:hypothetical protein
MNNPGRRAGQRHQQPEISLVGQVREDSRYGISTEAKKESGRPIGHSGIALHPVAAFFPQLVHDYEKDPEQAGQASNTCFC